jgi:hypothetical protein
VNGSNIVGAGCAVNLGSIHPGTIDRQQRTRDDCLGRRQFRRARPASREARIGSHPYPQRLGTPWKYGFKSIKSITRIEFVDERPRTFWNQLIPKEYGFVANVNPGIPHPRWSQASERLVGTGKKVKTLPYDGYGEYVAHLYG